MVYSEYSANNYRLLKISIGSIIKNQEMLKFVPNHQKTKKIRKHAVNKLLFVVRYAPDQYNTQEICDKAVL